MKKYILFLSLFTCYFLSPFFSIFFSPTPSYSQEIVISKGPPLTPYYSTSDCPNNLKAENLAMCIDLDDGEVWSCTKPQLGGDPDRCDSKSEWLGIGASISDNGNFISTNTRAILSSQSIGVNKITTPDLSSATDWITNPGWTISNGHATHTPGTANKLVTLIPNIKRSKIYRVVVEVTSQTTGTANLNLGVGCNSSCTQNFTVGTNTAFLSSYSDSGTVAVEIQPSSDSNIVIDAIYFYDGIYSAFTPDYLLDKTTNTAFGINTLDASTLSGVDNIGFGNNALHNNTQGSYNIAIGPAALYQNTTGMFNTGIGLSALGVNTTGTSNTSIGFLSGGSTTTGQANTILGHRALLTNITGSSNIAIGAFAAKGQVNPTGQFIVDSLDRADAATELTNAILVGQMASLPVNQTLRINADVTVSNKLLSSRTSDLGWSVVSVANQACNTTCTNAAVFGWDTGTSSLVNPSDATADKCVCAGVS